MIIWNLVSQQYPDDHENCILVNDDLMVFGCWTGSEWFVPDGYTPEGWTPTHYSPCNYPHGVKEGQTQ